MYEFDEIFEIFDPEDYELSLWQRREWLKAKGPLDEGEDNRELSVA